MLEQQNGMYLPGDEIASNAHADKSKYERTTGSCGGEEPKPPAQNERESCNGRKEQQVGG